MLSFSHPKSLKIHLSASVQNCYFLRLNLSERGISSALFNSSSDLSSDWLQCRHTLFFKPPVVLCGSYIFCWPAIAVFNHPALEQMKLVTCIQLKNICSQDPNSVQEGILTVSAQTGWSTHTPCSPQCFKVYFPFIFKTSLSCIIRLLIFGFYGTEMYA